MWPNIFYVSTATLCILCAIWTSLAALSVFRASESHVRRLTCIESEMQSTIGDVESWRKLTVELANSLKMSKIRRGMSISERPSSVDGEPDPVQDPEAWRVWMNARLRAEKFRG
jgi:hypothetical protein